MDEFETIHLLVSGEYEGHTVLGAFETPEDAHQWLGRQLLAGLAYEGPFDLEMCEFRRHLVDQPDVDPAGVLSAADRAAELNSGDVDAIANIITRARTGRPPAEAKGTPGAVTDRDTAETVVRVFAQRMADVRGMAAQDVETNYRALVAQLQDVLAGEPASDRIVDLGDAIGMVRELVREVTRLRRVVGRLTDDTGAGDVGPDPFERAEEMRVELARSMGIDPTSADAVWEEMLGKIRPMTADELESPDALDVLLTEAERVAALATDADWHNIDGRDQERFLRIARDNLGMPAVADPASRPDRKRSRS